MHNLHRRELDADEQVEAFKSDPHGIDEYLWHEVYMPDDDDPMTKDYYVDEAYYEAWESYKKKVKPIKPDAPKMRESLRRVSSLFPNKDD